MRIHFEFNKKNNTLKRGNYEKKDFIFVYCIFIKHKQRIRPNKLRS